MAPATKPKVVIVGGAGGGKEAYHVLRRDFDVTVVDANEYYEFTPSALRCMVEPDHANKILAPHPSTTTVGFAERVAFGQGASAGGTVTLRDGRTLPFNYLLVCCGSSYAPLIKPVPSPGAQGTIAARKASYQAANSKLKKAKSVLVVGGGSVGVELAAEIAGAFGKEKQVTIVSSSTRLLERLPKEAGAAAEKWLKDNGVNVLLGDRVDGLPEIMEASANGAAVDVHTKAGNSLQVDLVYSCAGPRANTDLLAGLGLEQNGWQPGQRIPVEHTLQVRGLPNFVFAAGDCSDSPEEKTLFAAGLSASLAALNIINLAAGKPLLRFPQDICFGKDHVPLMQNVSLSRKSGVMVMMGKVESGPSAAKMKGMVEFFMMKTAKGSKFWGGLWRSMGKMNLKQMCTAKQ